MGKVIVLDERRPDPPREPMAEITVYDNGDVTIWLSYGLGTPEQFNWALAKMAEASAVILEKKVEVTKTK